MDCFAVLGAGAIAVLMLARTNPATGAAPAASAAAAAPAVTWFDYDIVHTYPHDPEAFTQGLVFRDGYLYESTGLEKASTLRKVEIETGRVVQKIAVGEAHFAEGLAEDRKPAHPAHVAVARRARLRHRDHGASAHLPLRG